MNERKTTQEQIDLDKKWQAKLFDARSYDWPETDFKLNDLFELVKDIVKSRWNQGGAIFLQHDQIEVGIWVDYMPRTVLGPEFVGVESGQIDIEIEMNGSEPELFQDALTRNRKPSRMEAKKLLEIAQIVWEGHKQTPYKIYSAPNPPRSLTPRVQT